jgi:AcrR family transcriptional regulator
MLRWTELRGTDCETQTGADDVTRRDQISATAGEILEENGPDGLTMRAIAERLGIRAPSLYKHVSDKRELEVALIADAFTQQAEAFEKAVAAGGNTAMAIADAYRAWGLAHQHLYRLMNDQPLPREDLPAGLEDRAISAVLGALGGDRDIARAAWAFAHGMVMLEIADRFPPHADIDRAWRIGIEGIVSQAADTRDRKDRS